VSGNVPATLALTVGGPVSFGAFTPGLAFDYDASTTANVISTAGDGLLSVSDASSNHTGKLAGTGGPLAPVGGSANPTTLLTYSGPVSNDSVTLNFRQSIGANEPLRTGSYGKTLTFTLSTTQP
jgi:hypothetical protein